MGAHAHREPAHMTKTPMLLLRCGCQIPFLDGKAPICPTHGQQVIARVLRMPPPRIRGVARGPHVTTVDLAPFRGRLVGDEGVKPSA